MELISKATEEKRGMAAHIINKDYNLASEEMAKIWGLCTC